MTKYYPLIARAVAGLDQNTGEARRALYEHVRTALVNKLRGLDPPLSEVEITSERLGLEEAISRVEAEAARRSAAVEDVRDRPSRSLKGLVPAILAICIIILLGAAAYWLWSPISELVDSAQSPTGQTPRDNTTPRRPTIPDRVGQGGKPSTSAPITDPRSPSTAAVAQRVVLYDEDSTDAQGKRSVGSVIWRTETVSTGPSLPPELAVHADLELPERHITMTMSMRRNADQTLRASHTIEFMFNLPADFPFGGISKVPGVLMKQAEQTRGTQLVGLPVKVTPSLFLVGLSAVESEMQRNIQLVKEQTWFDIPIVYNNGRRAILAVEKGTPGERAFNDFFAALGQ